MRTPPNDPLDHEPEAITYARERAGLTITQLAQACNLPVCIVTEIEDGTSYAGQTTLGKIAKALNCPRVVLERKRESSPHRTRPKVHRFNKLELRDDIFTVSLEGPSAPTFFRLAHADMVRLIRNYLDVVVS